MLTTDAKSASPIQIPRRAEVAELGVQAAEGRRREFTWLGLATAIGIIGLEAIIGLTFGRMLLTRVSTLLHAVVAVFFLLIPAALGLIAMRLLGIRVLPRRRPARLIVGTDGVSIRWGWRRMFVPFTATSAIHVSGTSVIIQRNLREPLALVTSGSQEAEALARRLLDAIALGGQAESMVNLDKLDRQGQPLASWRKQLLALVHDEVSYRDTGLDRNDVLRVLEDGRAGPERRLAAALALSATEEPDIRQRIRIAAQACASDALRVAIEKAGDGELDEGSFEEATAAVRST